MRCLVLSNPNSTSHTPKLMAEVIPALREAATLTAMHTSYPGHAKEIVSGLRRSDYDAVIILGGDGTVNEVLQGMLGDDRNSRPAPQELPMLGIIPMGSANVFARALGFSNRPAEAARQLAAAMKAGQSRRLPAGWVDGQWFCVNVGFGMDAEVIGKMERIREGGGAATPWRYSFVAHQVWRKLRTYTPRIRFEGTSRDGEKFAAQVPFVIVTNTNPWTYAGPVPLTTNPQSSVDGGLALYAVHDMTGTVGFLTIARMLGVPLDRVAREKLNFRETRVDDITSVTLTSDKPLKWQLDGELGGETDRLEIFSIPQTIDVINPNPA